MAQSIFVSLFCHSDRKLRIAVLAVGKVVADVLLHIEISNMEIRRSRLRLQRASPFSISIILFFYSFSNKNIVLIHSLNDTISIRTLYKLYNSKKLLCSQSKKNVQSNTSTINNIFKKTFEISRNRVSKRSFFHCTFKYTLL